MANLNKHKEKLKKRAIELGLPEDATEEAIIEAESNISKPNEKDEFVNPFQKGTTYADFLNAKGEKTIDEYCKKYLTAEQIAWLETEIEHFLNKK